MSAVQPGYKMTEVGVIPEDWDVERVGKHATFRTGPFGSSLHQSDYIENGVPVINPMHIQKGEIKPSYKMTVSVNKVSKLSEFMLNAGDVIIGRRGEMGRCAVVEQSEAGWLCGTGSMIIKPISINSKLLQIILSSPQVVSIIEAASVGTTMINLNQGILSHIPIPLPPTKAEQEAIAEALSDADALIESIEQVIAKKRLIKQGAMQELLTGKRRLPGFGEGVGYRQTEVGVIPEDWGVEALGRISILMTNGFVGVAKPFYSTHETSVLYLQGYNIIENGFKFHGIKRVNADFHRQNSKSSLKAYDLLTVQTGDVGLTTVVPPSLEGANCHALIISRLKHNIAHAFFVSQYLNSHIGRSRLKEIEVGTTMKHLNVKEMLHFCVPLPTKAEQESIAHVLTDMDDELDALQDQLDKAREIKQGMMHELLTGRIRLV